MSSSAATRSRSAPTATRFACRAATFSTHSENSQLPSGEQTAKDKFIVCSPGRRLLKLCGNRFTVDVHVNHFISSKSGASIAFCSIFVIGLVLHKL